jgi:hypothetical protein
MDQKTQPKCTCGRSLSRDGNCWGWHTLSEEQWQAVIESMNAPPVDEPVQESPPQ